MTNIAASNAGVGRAVFTTRLQLSLQAANMCFWFGFLPGLILPILIWGNLVSPQDFDIVKLNVVASFSEPHSHTSWRIRDSSGRRQIIVATTDDGRDFQSLTPYQVRLALNSKWKAVQTFEWTLFGSLFLAVGAYLFAWWRISRLGSDSQISQRARGARDLVDGAELSKLVMAVDKSPYTFVDVALPKSAPMAGILVEGAQGSGKSLAIHDLMRQVFAKKKKCIIYDQSGEFYRAYFRQGKDFFFNPALEGSVPWSIFSEMQYVYDADTLAQAFLPPKGGQSVGPNAFFEDAARALFSVILLRLAENGAQNTSDIAKAFLEMPHDEMEKLIEKSVASSAVGGDSKAQRQGVISSISIYLNGIAAVAPGGWSIRDFIERDDDARLFILATADTKAMFSPLFRLILAVSFAVIESKQQIVHEDRFWYFLDESHTLGDVRLDDRLSTLRKFGVSIVSGIQSESQYFSSMGKERGETVMNCFNSVLILRMNEAGMMERAAARLSKQDVEVVSQNQALAVTEWRDGAGLSRTTLEKWLVMPGDVGSLGDCEGFLKLAGQFPAARVNYQSWLKPFFGIPGRVARFSAIQDSPKRDTNFALVRSHAAGSVDPFAQVAKAVKDAKDAKATSAQPDSSTGSMTPAVATNEAAQDKLFAVGDAVEREDLVVNLAKQQLGDMQSGADMVSIQDIALDMTRGVDNESL